MKYFLILISNLYFTFLFSQEFNVTNISEGYWNTYLLSRDLVQKPGILSRKPAFSEEERDKLLNTSNFEAFVPENKFIKYNYKPLDPETYRLLHQKEDKNHGY